MQSRARRLTGGSLLSRKFRHRHQQPTPWRRGWLKANCQRQRVSTMTRSAPRPAPPRRLANPQCSLRARRRGWLKATWQRQRMNTLTWAARWWEHPKPNIFHQDRQPTPWRRGWLEEKSQRQRVNTMARAAARWRKHPKPNIFPRDRQPTPWRRGWLEENPSASE